VATEMLEEILHRIESDQEFRTAVIYWPADTLKDYELSDAEKRAFETRDFSKLDVPRPLAEALRNRLDTSGF
jgi:hypothetical protein